MATGSYTGVRMTTMRRLISSLAIVLMLIPTAPRPASAEFYTAEEVALAAIPAIDRYWRLMAESNQFFYVSPKGIYWYNTPDSPGPSMSLCGQLPLANAVYCPADMSIYLDYEFMASIVREVGDYAAALVIAHEWAHHIQHIVGIFSTRDGIVDQPGEVFSMELELLADCWSGSATAYMRELGMIETGDLDEGYTIVFLLGDEHSGMPVDPFSSNAHGTSDQRLNSYSGGAMSTEAANCFGIASDVAGIRIR